MSKQLQDPEQREDAMEGNRRTLDRMQKQVKRKFGQADALQRQRTLNASLQEGGDADLHRVYAQYKGSYSDRRRMKDRSSARVELGMKRAGRNSLDRHKH